jgi:tRNA pseudouridine55 synthase
LSLRWEGLLLVDKPPGPTSHDVVARARKISGQRRIGHSGTLDPLASGLLPLVLGRATRLVRFLPQAPKEYRGTFRLGLTTRTDDLAGELLSRHDGPLPSAEEVVRASAGFQGHLLQEPPAVSAKKVGGERLYRLARRGQEVRPVSSSVEVTLFTVEPTPAQDTFTFLARVSAGTYIRALVRDLGAALGCGGALASLRRTGIGPMVPDPKLELGSHPEPGPERLREALIPLEAMPLTPPNLTLDRAADPDRFRNGARIDAPPGAPVSGYVTVRAADGGLIGIGETEGGHLCPRVVLPPLQGDDL